MGRGSPELALPTVHRKPFGAPLRTAPTECLGVCKPNAAGWMLFCAGQYLAGLLHIRRPARVGRR